jgi:hypothetical protein
MFGGGIGGHHLGVEQTAPERAKLNVRTDSFAGRISWAWVGEAHASKLVNCPGGEDRLEGPRCHEILELFGRHNRLFSPATEPVDVLCLDWLGRSALNRWSKRTSVRRKIRLWDWAKNLVH